MDESRRNDVKGQSPAAAVMVQFQQLMGQFLQTQAAVMTAFLRGTSNGNGHQVVAPLPVAALPPPAVPLPVEEIAGETPAPPGAAARREIPPPALAAAPQRDFSEELRALVSERTGYPAEMLDLDAGIEADLGVDSIKRVEILSAFQRQCATAEQPKIQAVMEQLTAARSLRDIADRIAAALDGAATAGGLKPAATAPQFTLAAVPYTEAPAGRRHYPDRVCLITDDEAGIAKAVADELTRAGERPVLLRHDPRENDLTDAASVAAAVEHARTRYGPIGAVIHLLPLRDTAAPERLRLDVRSLYALARATESDLKSIGKDGGALFATVTAQGGEFGLRPDASVRPTHHALASFVQTLALEFTAVRCKVVDVAASESAAVIPEKLLDELMSPDDTLFVGRPDGRRLTVAPRVVPPAMRAGRRLDKDSVFLLTGGARGITAEIARAVAERYRPILILAGASPYPAAEETRETAGLTEPAALKAAIIAQLRAAGAAVAVKPADVEAAYQRLLRQRAIRANVDALRRAGARVAYHSLDVRDQAALAELIDGIYRDHGRLDVVIHGAGVIEDKFIRDKTPESFDRVVHTKADSAFVLSRKLRFEGLQCLMFMSSVTAAFGNRGQADYAAANGVLNGLAMQLAAQWPGRVVSMNWGPWDGSGMVTDQTRRQFEEHGIQVIPPQAGVEAAMRLIEAGAEEPITVVGDGPWAKLARLQN